eukprot:m.182742 g.182742  ORF g.182742 m.182742 type:complete len:74 (-) comp13591_c9_seq1:1541-1762(-)
MIVDCVATNVTNIISTVPTQAKFYFRCSALTSITFTKQQIKKGSKTAHCMCKQQLQQQVKNNTKQSTELIFTN